MIIQINEEIIKIILDIDFSLMVKAMRFKMDSIFEKHICVIGNLPIGIVPSGS